MSAAFDDRSGSSPSQSRDLLVPPGSHAFVQMTTSGEVRVVVGPRPITFSGQERPVRFNDTNDSFEPCAQEQSLRKNVSVREGYYAILENPAIAENGHIISPTSDANQSQQKLQMGRRVIVRGPVDFALWPRQKATVIQGHSLRSNQYLEAVVYDSDNARKNWNSAAMVSVALQTDPNAGSQQSDPKTAQGDPKTAQGDPKAQQSKQTKKEQIDANTLVMGQRLIITGESVSFYIPPTGVEVIKEENGNYVREAVTLERLEYCILVDENGNKRYENGPAVVFPRATERFFSANGTRKFKAIELPSKAGIHVKVIADYDEPGIDGQQVRRKAGEELFITGETQSIYYPSEFHSIIKYGDGQLVHFGVAIPKGEGRYVMNRITGEIKTVNGPEILVCDPRTEVIVRRILTDKQCEDWYPGNTEALRHNQQLRQIQEAAGGSRGDVVEDSYTRGFSNATRLTKNAVSSMYASSGAAGSGLESSTFEERAASAVMADEITRSSKFTPPRSLTLNTKYEGVPSIDVWTGYAVMVVDKGGERRVVQGPATVLLGYDETLEILTLSTGKPKTTDKLYRTVYLRTQSNKVSDYVEVETSDHVRVSTKLSFNVNFEGQDGEKWFTSENYVKLLCDHVRSMLKGAVKKYTIQHFNQNATQIIRDTILGEKGTDGRAGMIFGINGMRVVDVEVLEVRILDERIASMLTEAQRKVVETNIELETRRRDLKMIQEKEAMSRDQLTAAATTASHRNSIQLTEIADGLKVNLERIKNQVAEADATRDAITARLKNEEMEHDSELARDRATAEQELEQIESRQTLAIQLMEKETAQVTARFQSVSGNFTEALAFLSREENLVKVAQAVSFQTLIGGKSVSDALNGIFGENSPIAARLTKMLGQMASNPLAAVDQR